MTSSLRAFVDRVVASRLLQPNLVELADRGAIAEELDRVPSLPAALRDLLAWRNGMDLDVIRLHGVGSADRPIELADAEGENGAIVFASDPAGFRYLIRRWNRRLLGPRWRAN
jgi:hypothetical protein